MMKRRTFLKAMAGGVAMAMAPVFLNTVKLPPPAYVPSITKRYRFPAGTMTGTLTEVGIMEQSGPVRAARSVIQLPEPVTVLADEELELVYEVSAEETIPDRIYVVQDSKVLGEATSADILIDGEVTQRSESFVTVGHMANAAPEWVGPRVVVDCS